MLRFHRGKPLPARFGSDGKLVARSLALTAVFFTWCAACAERIPEPVVVPTVPHVSWLIAVHTPSGDERTVCQSDPRSDCVLPASTADNRTFATVHLYLHPVKSGDTKYSGTMRVEFLNGAASETEGSKVDSTVRPGNTPMNASVTGIVTEKRGAYTIAISLVAVPSGGTRIELRDSVSITVQ